MSKISARKVGIFFGNLSLSGSLMISSSMAEATPYINEQYSHSSSREKIEAKVLVKKYQDTRRFCSKSQGEARRACFANLADMTEAYRQARLRLQSEDYKAISMRNAD